MDTIDGVFFVAYGEKARAQAGMAIQALRTHSAVNICVMSDRPLTSDVQHIIFPDSDKGARWPKLNINLFTPYTNTLYMDADTRTHGNITRLFEILHDGWDVIIAPSTQQDAQCLRHLDSDDERQATFEELQNPFPLQLQGGVMGFRRSNKVARLFECWRDEWRRWQDKDQGALLRALDKVHPCVWLLSNEFNGGAVVKHYFGQARRR